MVFGTYLVNHLILNLVIPLRSDSSNLASFIYLSILSLLRRSEFTSLHSETSKV